MVHWCGAADLSWLLLRLALLSATDMSRFFRRRPGIGTFSPVWWGSIG
jgi:hypothetical protein